MAVVAAVVAVAAAVVDVVVAVVAHAVVAVAVVDGTVDAFPPHRDSPPSSAHQSLRRTTHHHYHTGPVAVVGIVDVAIGRTDPVAAASVASDIAVMAAADSGIAAAVVVASHCDQKFVAVAVAASLPAVVHY